MKRLVCNGCATQHCELTVAKAWPSDYVLMCPLVNLEEGPVPGEWRERQDRCKKGD